MLRHGESFHHSESQIDQDPGKRITLLVRCGAFHLSPVSDLFLQLFPVNTITYEPAHIACYPTLVHLANPMSVTFIALRHLFSAI